MLETLREEVERQRAMRLAASRASDGQREIENEALRDELSANEQRHAEAIKELSMQWQKQAGQMTEAHEAAMRRVLAESEKRIAQVSAAAGEGDVADASRKGGGGAGGDSAAAAGDEGGGALAASPAPPPSLHLALKEARSELKQLRHELEQTKRRSNHAMEQLSQERQLTARLLAEAVGGLRERASAVLASASVLQPPVAGSGSGGGLFGGSAAAAPAAASIVAVQELGGQLLAASQQSAESMLRRLWSACAQASRALGVQPPPPVHLDGTAPLPSLGAAHAMLLEQLLMAVRDMAAARHPAPSSTSAFSAAAAEDDGGASAPGDASGRGGGGGGMSVAISRNGEKIESAGGGRGAGGDGGGGGGGAVSAKVPRVVRGPAAPRVPNPPAAIKDMEARTQEAAQRQSQKVEQMREAQRMAAERAMESFATIAYHGGMHGELRSCLDSTPFSRDRPQSAGPTGKSGGFRSRHFQHNLPQNELPPWGGAAASGGGVASAAAHVASTIDLVYPSASPAMRPPVAGISSFEGTPVAVRGGLMGSSASSAALAVPLLSGGEQARSNSAASRRRQERTPARPTSALERGQRASAGALSQPVHGMPFFVQPGGGGSGSESASLRRPKSAAVLVGVGPASARAAAAGIAAGGQLPAADAAGATQLRSIPNLTVANAPVAATSLPSRSQVNQGRGPTLQR